jgi:putative nucleotidyltransferase with HDIG domain
MNEKSMPQDVKHKGALAGLPWAYLRIPPFPQVAIRVLQLANHENVQLHQLSDLILSDPAFASEVLTIANSMLYAPRFPSSSVLQAIAALGINNLQGLCLTVGARAYLGKSLNLAAMRVLWRHNVACALIAGELASAGFIDKDTAYTAGVLHDIGRLALATVKPKEYAQLLDAHQGSPQSLLDAEREIFGCDHCEMGGQLVQEWMLPIDFEAVIVGHHAPRSEDEVWGLPALINLSCRMADTVGFPAFDGCEAAPYERLLEEMPARERRQFYYADAESLAAEVERRIRAAESA